MLYDENQSIRSSGGFCHQKGLPVAEPQNVHFYPTPLLLRDSPCFLALFSDKKWLWGGGPFHVENKKITKLYKDTDTVEFTLSTQHRLLSITASNYRIER